MAQEESIQDRVYGWLRKQILELILLPGTTVSTKELAEQLGVSRTPVREALLRLEREGMVVMLPQKETVVSLIDLERVRQERFLRRSLELAALREFVARRRFEDLEALNGWIGRQAAAGSEREFEQFLACDDGFHREIFLRAGQELCWSTVKSVCTHNQRIRLLTLRDPEWAQRVITQHVEILQAAESGEAERACQILASHLDGTKSREELIRREFPDYIA